MTAFGIIANAKREAIIKALALLKDIDDFNIIFIKQSDDEKLYIVTEKVFSVVNKNGGKHNDK